MSLFTVGISLTPNSGGFVAVRKVQRQTGRKRDAWTDGWKHTEPVWESVACLVGAEALSGTVPDMVGRIAALLRNEELVDDVQKRVDVSVVGRPVLRLLSEQRAYASPVRVEGERPGADNAGTETLPLSTLQGVMSVMFATDRIEVSDDLADGRGLLHSLRGLAALEASGPARDLGIAAALAVWLVHESPCSGPWASNKPVPPNREDEWAREARRQAKRQAAASARANGAPWWTSADDDEW
jgi:hypothetical protein